MADRPSAEELVFAPDTERRGDRGARLQTEREARGLLGKGESASGANRSAVLGRAYVVMAAFWAVALPLATFLVSRSHPGSASYGFAFTIYGLASRVCHQLPSRTFALWGTPMPVCARCTGIYLAGAVAALALSARRRSRPILPSIARAMLLASLLPGAMTLLYEWITGVVPENWIRATSGLPIGFTVSWVILAALAVNRRSDEVN